MCSLLTNAATGTIGVGSRLKKHSKKLYRAQNETMVDITTFFMLLLLLSSATNQFKWCPSLLCSRTTSIHLGRDLSRCCYLAALLDRKFDQPKIAPEICCCLCFLGPQLFFNKAHYNFKSLYSNYTWPRKNMI